MHMYFYCIFIDLNEFKAVNDQYGHPVGDKVLNGLATAIKAVSRDDDLAGRMGGDEFLMFVQGPSGDWVNDLMQRLTTEFEQLLLAQNLPNVVFSYGYAMTDDKFFDLQQLISLADKAMYQAKTEKP